MNSYSELRMPMMGRISMANRVCANGGVTTASETLGHKLLMGKADTQTEIAPAIADLVQRG
jgi:ApbE superfamily uncharacterized protein (UPF0280 family)